MSEGAGVEVSPVKKAKFTFKADASPKRQAADAGSVANWYWAKGDQLIVKQTERFEPELCDWLQKKGPFNRVWTKDEGKFKTLHVEMFTNSDYYRAKALLAATQADPKTKKTAVLLAPIKNDKLPNPTIYLRMQEDRAKMTGRIQGPLLQDLTLMAGPVENDNYGEELCWLDYPDDEEQPRLYLVSQLQMLCKSVEWSMSLKEVKDEEKSALLQLGFVNGMESDEMLYKFTKKEAKGSSSSSAQ